MRTKRHLIYYICASLFFLAFSARAALETNIWTGGAGSWTNAAKWSLGVVPNNTSASNYVALIANGSSISSAVEIDPSVSITINQLVLDAIDSLAISNNATLELTNSLTVNGTIKLLSSNNFTELEFTGGGTLGGTGSVVMAGFTPQYDILNLQNGPVTNGSGITLQGAGSIDGDCSFPLVNQGTISAELSNLTLSVSCVANQGRLLATNGAGLTVTTFTNDNNGTITATGATLQLAGVWSNSGVISGNVSAIDLGGTFTTAGLGTFQNVGGAVTLDGILINSGNTLTLGPTTGGSWLLDAGTIRGGTVAASGGAQLILPVGDSGTFDGVTLDTSLTISNNATLYVSTNGVVLNSTTITLASSNNFTDLIFLGGGTLGGAGSVVMAGFSPQDDIVNLQNGPVTNGPGITIQGAGSIDGDCTSPLVNQGTISADLSNFTLAVSCVANQGRLLATNGAALSVTTFTNDNNGTITATGATLQLAGVWSNSGVISGNVSAIDLGGTFTAAGLGTLNRVGGAVALDGTLINSGSTLTLNATTGSWLLNGGMIRGGTVTTSGGAQLILPVGDSGTLDGVTLLDTSLTISNNYDLYVTTNGVVLNSTTITLASSNNFTELVFTGGGTLGGTGSVVMGGFSPQDDILNLQNGPVTNGPCITIQGAGSIDGDCSFPLVNQGTISANLSNQTLALACFANQGQLTALNQGTLQLAGTWSNTGVISNSASSINLGGTFTTAGLGSIIDDPGTITLAGILINSGSTITLNATTGSWLFNGGTIRGGTLATSGGAQLILPIGDNGTLDGVTLDTSLTISNNYDLYVTTNGVVLNSTTITLASSNNFTELVFTGGGTLGGTGSVVMAGFTPQYDIVNLQNGPVTNGPGITIQGAGSIDGDCSFPLVNQGTISANLSNFTLAVSCINNQGQLSALNGAGLTVTTFTNDNNGTITATGGTLALAGVWSNGGVISGNVSAIDLGGTFTTAGLGTFNHVGGTVTLDGILVNTGNTLALNATTGSWLLNGGTIRGGTVTTTGGAQLILPVGDSGTLDGVTLDTSLIISNNYDLYVTTNGVVLNSTTITLASSNNFTELVFTGGGTLGGAGSVVMAGFTPQYDIVNLQNGPVTNGPGITIEGAGSIDGDCASPLVNQGTISADLSNQTLAVSCFANQGQLIALNGGTFYSSTVLTNSGAVTIGNASALQFQGNYVQTGGSTVLEGGQLTAGSGASVLIEDGSLGGGGFVTAVVTNFSSIVPGPAPSPLVFSTNLVLNAGSTLNFQLGGSAPTQYGTAVLSNGVNLAGNLAVSLVNSFVPTTGSSFTVLTSVKPITGSFGNITSGSPIGTIGGAGTFTYIQNSNSIVLENFQTSSQTNSPSYSVWAQYYFGCTNDGSLCAQAAPNAGPDGTGFSNTNLFLAGFNPTNSAAYPHIISIAKINSNTDINVIYVGADGDSSWSPGYESRTNVLEFTTGTASGGYSNDFTSTGQTNILSGGTGLGIITNMVDRGGATNQPARYYRIEVIAP